MTLSELKCEKLKVSLYGENTLKISAGESTEQIVKLFGDNFMDTGGLNSQYVKANSYGESEARIQSQAIVRVSSLGESKLYISGKAHIEKGLIIGENRIRRVY